jgi:hypothetical protein
MKLAAAGSRIIVPKAAVQQLEGRDIVWVVKDNRVERRAVTVGGTAGEEVIIVAGLGSGESVVVQKSGTLEDGARISQK